MTKRIFVDRSRYELGLRCKRARFWEYHFAGRGIVSARRALPLAVGSSVHVGLATLLQEMIGDEIPKFQESWLRLEESAVRAALADFAQYQSALDLGDERKSLPDGWSRDAADEYLFKEQSNLVEAMVRAYSRRRLRPLLAQFEVLEVEREGEWLLGEWAADRGDPHYLRSDPDYSLRFLSRPDALLRERESNTLHLLSYKTAASWDARKARDAEHDMQGLSEGIEIERRLVEWWDEMQKLNGDRGFALYGQGGLTSAMETYLRGLPAPPRILAVRYEFLLKGERWTDDSLTARFGGVETRAQKSHLVRAYLNPGMTATDEQWNWSFAFRKDDGSASKLYYKNWRPAAVWERMPIREWIDRLDSAAVTLSGEDSTVGLEPRALGYQCSAQATGYTDSHPLDAVFIPPITLYRNEDELRDLVEQMESVERGIAEAEEAVHSAADEGERRHALNVGFPMTRHACEYPGTCAYTKLCFGGEDIRRDPVGSGLYTIRKANHPVEESEAANG